VETVVGASLRATPSRAAACSGRFSTQSGGGSTSPSQRPSSWTSRRATTTGPRDSLLRPQRHLRIDPGGALRRNEARHKDDHRQDSGHETEHDRSRGDPLKSSGAIQRPHTSAMTALVTMPTAPSLILSPTTLTASANDWPTSRRKATFPKQANR
jgi:hypothetical protein